jgi:hypothetical protein
METPEENDNIAVADVVKRLREWVHSANQGIRPMTAKKDNPPPRNSATVSGSDRCFFRHWRRVLWAVEMRSRSCRPEGMILGRAWHEIESPRYAGEPTRCMLFRTRRQARAWCKEAAEKHSKHSPDWKFRPIRVREIIEANDQEEARRK